jgi:low affinity Fe/Cu permease
VFTHGYSIPDKIVAGGAMPKKKPDIFNKFTTAVAMAMGQPWVFTVALIVLILWGISGPLLGFSDTWQLIINTSTTIITFLMVFIIQNTQNRDNLALNIKLDAIMTKMGVTEDELYVAEEESDARLEDKKKKMQRQKTTSKKGRRK